MLDAELEMAIAEFKRAKGGFTQCPTRFAVESQAAIPPPPMKVRGKPASAQRQKSARTYAAAQKEHTARFALTALAVMDEVARGLGVNQSDIKHAIMARELNSIRYPRNVYKTTGIIQRPWNEDDVRFVRRIVSGRGLTPQPK